MADELDDDLAPLDRVWDADDYETAEDTAADELPPMETVTAFAEQGLL
jgi:hypothetical protein